MCEIKTSCSSCVKATLKSRFYTFDKKSNVTGENLNPNYGKYTVFICGINKKEVLRSDTCGNYKLNESKFKGNKIEYCPECDSDTYSKDWYCSVCWCDRVDSELFEDEFGNINT